jgi:glycine cleavage system H lipoate-binding protein
MRLAVWHGSFIRILQSKNKEALMVPALVLMTFLVWITISFIRGRRSGVPNESQVLLEQRPQGVERYFYPGHSWVLVEGSRQIRVGVDDLVPRVIGKIDKVEIAKMGSAVRQGEPLVTLHSGSRSLRLGSPLSGVVEEINPSLSAHPALLADSPLERGWVAKIAPGNLSAEIKDLLNGSAARQWREAVQIQVASWFSPRLGAVLQDGGEWIENVSSLLNDDEWKEMTHALFLTGPFKRSKN